MFFKIGGTGSSTMRAGHGVASQNVSRVTLQVIVIIIILIIIRITGLITMHVWHSRTWHSLTA